MRVRGFEEERFRRSTSSQPRAVRNGLVGHDTRMVEQDRRLPMRRTVTWLLALLTLAALITPLIAQDPIWGAVDPVAPEINQGPKRQEG